MKPRHQLRTDVQVRTTQQQRLALTPQVRQTIEMLSLPAAELRLRIEQELLENPALEEAPEGDEEEFAEVEDDEEEEVEDPAAEEEPDAMSEILAEDFFRENHDNTGGLALSEEPPSLERTLAAGRTLSDHLVEQLGLSVEDERDRAIGVTIIGNLDARGYLDGSVEEVAAQTDLTPPARVREVEAVRQRILRFDPVGSASLDLTECLLVQLEFVKGDTAPLRTIVREHLDLVARERFRDLAKRMKVDFASIVRWVRRLGELDLRPGLRFSTGREQVVVPDARVYRVGGRWRVEMNERIPRIRANPLYRRIARSQNRHTAADKEFARDAWSRARGFQRSVQQQQETVRLVAEDIVRKQEDFLNEGIDKIRPMVLNDVARDIGRAESTVSRVVANKYFATPRGVIPFRRFFHSALALRDGRQVSSEAVRARVQRIVKREDPDFPLTDEQIVRLLERRGIMIARRTVAKYRKALRIPSSNERRIRYRNRLTDEERRGGAGR